MTVIQIGPFTLDGLIFLSVLAFAIAMLTAIWYDKKYGGRVERFLWWLTLVALLIGRTVFVLRFWPSYQSNPIEIINIRDGGFDWQASLIVYGFALVWLMLRRHVLLLGLCWSLGMAAIVIGLGLMWLQPWQKTYQNWYQMAHLQQLRPIIFESNTLKEPNTLVEDGIYSSNIEINASKNILPTAQYQGKPTVINLWATWCPPCRREMPVLQRAQNEYKDVNFVFINQGESAEDVAAFLEEQGLELRNLWLDKNALSGQAIDSKGLPSTIFLDAQGNILSARLGELSAASLQSHLDSIRIQK